MIICTLFNSLYLDKGLVLYESLSKVTKELKLFVLTMDDRCYDVLCELNYDGLIPIRLSDFENEELQYIKPFRSVGEYCWTCTPWLIEYILTKYDAQYCTYVDADMAFYSDPYIVIEEMEGCNASVQIVEHRFNSFEAKRSEKKVGRYCVEFNTFKNDTEGRMLLNLWKYQCLNKCTIKEGNGRYWGDQKYLNYWAMDYPFVLSTNHIGVGVAPWNMLSYEYTQKDNVILVTRDAITMPLICCHFEAITYINDKTVDIHAVGGWNAARDEAIVNLLYIPYLQKIQSVQQFLKDKFGILALKAAHQELKRASFSDRLSNMKGILLNSNPFAYFFCFKIPKLLFGKRNLLSVE